MKDKLVARLSSHLKTSSNGGGDRQKESSSGDGRRGRGHGKVCGTSSGGHGGSRGSGNARNHGRGNVGRGSGGGSSDVTKDECHYCGKKGHWARECKKKKRDEEVHTAQVEEEDEPSLFMAITTVIEPITVQAHPATVHFEENKLFVQLGEKGSGDSARWILDSGVTNHMTRVHAVFSEINLRVHGVVQFGDGSLGNIEGCGTILIKCKTKVASSSCIGGGGVQNCVERWLPQVVGWGRDIGGQGEVCVEQAIHSLPRH
jgi:hypothetical protein